FDEESKPNLPAGSIFRHNCYFGPWKNGLPDDPEALLADPMFLAPGTGGEGLCTLEGYQLQTGSPCINTGIYIPFNGGRDFYGNVVKDGHPDFGAFEFLGSGAFSNETEEAARDKDAADASSVAWAKWMFPGELFVNDTKVVSIKLREALEDGITGFVTFENPKSTKPIQVDLSKLKDRSIIDLKVNTDKETLMGCRLRVSIRKGKYAEEWELPFTERPARRR
ncbi:MAG: hypothetical protein PHZ15_08200, partial [Bacteroidales bacterium]|nr:hypothetical protein [Bacteroidales bacterium]